MVEGGGPVNPYPEAVRASVHAFNTEAEIDALVAALEDCGGIDP